MKRILISFLCSLSFLFADLNPGYLPKGTEIVSLRTANARHYSNGDGTIRAVIEPTNSSILVNDSLIPNFSGFSELGYLYGSLYQQVKHTTPVRNAFFCGYWGEYYPDIYILERGWVEWDISSIPNFAVINNLICRTYRTEITGTYSNVRLSQMTNRPSGSADAFTLYNDAGDGLYGEYSTVGGWNSFNLNQQAKNDFQSHLSDDWFAIGYTGTGPTIGNVTWEIGFGHHTSSWPPRLIVDYSLPYDVGVTKIISPTGTIDSVAEIAPACSVYNYGNREENYSVRMRIGSFYNQTASVSGHSPGTSLYLTFPGWTAQEVGTFPVSCSTELGRDLRGENDKKTDSVIVRRQVKDVGVDSIIRPYVYESQGPLRPKALVKNYGETEESCWVYFRINIHLGALVYSDSQFISLLPDSTREVEFREWQATGPLLYLARCSTALEGDVQPENDKKERIFLVEALVSDVGVLEIKRPRGDISPGPIRPEARIYNYGRYPESFFAYFRIISEEGEVYYDSSYVSELYPGSYQDVLFDEWNAEIGNYTAECSTALSTDQNHLNDKMSVSFRVRIPSAGWILVGNVPLSPDNKKIKSGGGVTECGGNIYILKGNNTRSLYRYLPNSSSAVFEDSVPIGSGKKVKKGSGIVSDGERYIYIFKGSNTKEFFRYDTRRETTWKELAPVLGDKGLKGGTGVCYLSGFIYLLKGSNTTEFYRYHTGENRWEQLQSPPRNKGFKDGSSLVAFNDKVYLLGDNYNNFYRYSPDANSWDTLKPLPLYHPQVRKKKKVKEGAAMAVKDGKIFAFKGGNTSEFWVYNPEEDSWSGLDTIPKFPDGKRVKGGGSLIALGEEIWALKGNNTTSIWKYIGEKMPFSTFSINKETMDLIRNDWKNSLRITPNPTKGLTTVCSKDKGKIMTLRVYNTLGELVYWAKSNKGIFTVKKLPKGVYLVRISAPGDEKKEKLVILK